MPHVDLKFIEAGDACWPDLAEKLKDGTAIYVDQSLQIAYLRGGMQSGKGSVTLRYDLPDGRTVLAETSAEMLIAVSRALAAKEQA